MRQEVQGPVQEAPGPARSDSGGVQGEVGLQEESVPDCQGIGQAAEAEDAGYAAVEAAENCVVERGRGWLVFGLSTLAKLHGPSLITLSPHSSTAQPTKIS